MDTASLLAYGGRGKYILALARDEDTNRQAGASANGFYHQDGKRSTAMA